MLALLLALVPFTTPLDERDELAQLLAGVATLPAPGVPGPLAVFGGEAFPVVLGAREGDGRLPAIAAARAGRGRILLFGHGGYANAVAEPGMGPFLRNAVAWLGAGRDEPRLGAAERWSDALPKAGLRVTASGAEVFERLDALDVVAVHVLSLDAEKVARLAAFVEAGGGVLAAETGWGWQQLNEARVLAEQPAQVWLARHGLAFTLDTLERTHELGFACGPLEPGRWNALAALERLVKAERKPELRTSDDERLVLLAARALPPGESEFGTRLAKLARERSGQLVASEKAPLTRAQPLHRVLVAAEQVRLERASGEVRAHPAAEDFPGRATAPGVTQTLELDVTLDGWHSTGLWADAGTTVTVRLPREALALGLRLRIGAHADTLWHLDAWRRMPEITREFALTGEETRVASPFGGALYLVAPGSREPLRLALTLEGAIPAPHFVLGRTSASDWRAARRRPAPWAELEGQHLVLSVPSRVVRELDDPTALLEFWDGVLEAQAELAARPRTGERPERFVLDRQISAGYMHSGYPIMTHLDVAEAVVDLAGLQRGAHLWGFVHELGHNLQVEDWTFEGTGEVTNNLFALYAIEQRCTLPAGQRGHDAVDSPPDVAAYLARGARFDEWKREPFLALRTYTLVQEAFGWAPFRTVFAEYAALPLTSRPRNDDERRDQWLVRLSRAVGRNLGPYFTAWGIPTGDAARAEVAHLPAWMPADWPR